MEVFTRKLVSDRSSTDRQVHLAETNRVEAFSDGVFAIVITLLVLDLRLPDHEPGGLLSGLIQQWPGYLAYLTSFLYIGVVWMNHPSAFGHIRYVDRRLKWANLGILLTTSLLPFPTVVISATIQRGEIADERTAVALYALVGVLLTISWLIFFYYLSRHPELTENDLEAGYFREDCKRASAGIFLYAWAGLLGYVLTPYISLAIFLAMPIFYGITSEGAVFVRLVRGRQRVRVMTP